MVEAHGGELSVESEVGRGSRFFFGLPRATQAAREMTALERRFVEYRTYPFFSVLVIDLDGALPPPGGAGFDAVGAELRSALPRSADRIMAQSAQQRFVLILLGTDRQGATVVRDRLSQRLAEHGARVLGPAAYPDDGTTSFQILRAVLASDAGRSTAAPDALPTALTTFQSG
jgi:hypothetical protein